MARKPIKPGAAPRGLEALPTIGQFLVGMRQISPEQTALVLDQQNLRPYKLFGELAVELGFVKDPTVRGYLTRKSFI